MIEITTLPNGFRIVTDTIQSFDSVALGIWINVGARNETLEEHGLAHLLEHMAFKGTKKRNARQIAEDIENVGGIMNAYTGRDQTAYYARVLKEDVALAIDIITDILQNSIFDEEELKREKGVILQEIGECEDTPDDIIFDYLQEICFPEQALGRPILGTRESVKAMTQEQIFKYVQKHYLPQNMIFAASGNINHKDIVDMVTQAFDFKDEQYLLTTEKAQWQGGTKIIHKELEQVHLAMSFEGVSYYDNDYYIAEVFSTIMGGGMSSRLFQEIREKRGLAYTISTFSSSLKDTGQFGLYAGTSPEDIPELLKVAIDEFSSIEGKLDDVEVNRAKAQIKSSLVMGLESLMGRCEMMVRQLFIFDKLHTVQELIDKVNLIDIEHLNAFANRLLNSKSVALCTYGDLKEIKDYNTIMARFLP